MLIGIFYGLRNIFILIRKSQNCKITVTVLCRMQMLFLLCLSLISASLKTWFTAQVNWCYCQIYAYYALWHFCTAWIILYYCIAKVHACVQNHCTVKFFLSLKITDLMFTKYCAECYRKVSSFITVSDWWILKTRWKTADLT